MGSAAHTLFISDLHLHETRPEATDLMQRYLAGPARSADAVYVLGDLFEYWLGDDVSTPLSEQVAEALAQLRASGVPVFFVHGNRDFLLGAHYADLAGMQILGEETVVDLYGTPTLVLHGDQLCTDDVAYQKARATMRDPAWQAQFLARTPADRAALARDARRRSEEYKTGASEEIMDVNTAAVTDAFRRHDVRHMIHGHTHRPAIHDLTLDRRPAQRIVLGDWFEQGSVLRVDARARRLETLTF